MYTLEVTLNDLPKTTNAKRRHNHWAQNHKEALRWKGNIGLYLKSKRPMSGPLERAKILYVRRSSVEPDYDGLVSSFKHVQDCLVEAQILVDDTSQNVYPTYKWEKAPPKKGSIFIRVEEME